MTLRFACNDCGQPIVVRFLTVGEEAHCARCGGHTVVPATAEVVDGKTPSSAPFVASDPAPTTPPRPDRQRAHRNIRTGCVVMAIGCGLFVFALLQIFVYARSWGESGVDPALSLFLGVIALLGFVVGVVQYIRGLREDAAHRRTEEDPPPD